MHKNAHLVGYWLSERDGVMNYDGRNRGAEQGDRVQIAEGCSREGIDRAL